MEKQADIRKKDSSLYELIHAIAPEMRSTVRRHLSVYHKEDNTATVNIFDAYLAEPTDDETNLREAFPELPDIKKDIYRKILDALAQVLRPTEAELNISRQIEHAYVLEKLNLYEQAMKAIATAKSYCDDNALFFSKALLHQRESAVGNYLKGIKRWEFLNQIIEEQTIYTAQTDEISKARILYLLVLKEEAYYNDKLQQQGIALPENQVENHPLFLKENTDHLNLAAAIYIAKAKRTYYYYKDNIEACYQAEAPIERRIRINDEPISAVSKWNWLVDRFAMHEKAKYYEAWHNDLNDLTHLCTTYFKRDSMRKSFIIRYKLELAWYAYDADTNQLPELIRTLDEAEGFLNSIKQRINDQPTAFLLSSVLLIYLYLSKWEKAEATAEDFTTRVDRNLTPTISRFARLIKPFIYIERSINGSEKIKLFMYEALRNWVAQSRGIMRNYPDANYHLEQLITNFAAGWFRPDAKHYELLKKLIAGLELLLHEEQEKNQEISGITAFHNNYSLLNWAKETSKKFIN